MPGRQSHGRSLISQPSDTSTRRKGKSKAKSQSAYLDAFGIASKQDQPSAKRLRAQYLEAEDEPRARGKRAGHADEDDQDKSGDDGNRPPPRKKRAQAMSGGNDDGGDGNGESGSDSEGNEWMLGGLMKGEEDEEIDSDDAFGEGEGDKHRGHTLRVGKDKASPTKAHEHKRRGSDNEDEDDGDEDDDMESLGEDAIDLATALDQYEEESEEEAGDGGDGGLGSGDEDGSTPPSSEDENDDSSDDDDDEDDDDDDDDDDDGDDDGGGGDDEKLSSLKGLISGFADQDQEQDQAKASSRQKVDLKDLGLFGGSVKDAQMKKSMRLMSREAKEKRPGAAKRLEVPLARRQQDKVLRSAAYEKAKETLERWTETVKHNRRAQHLVFPLPQNMPQMGIDATELAALDIKDPANELEQTIASIMEQSGLSLNKPPAPSKSKEAQDAIQDQMSAAELRAMVNHKRLKRELNSREARRTKRIKKIKSKAFHRVHRKDLERKQQKLAEDMEETGEAMPSEDEREAYDRQRALERVGGRHRDSKWAKAGTKIKRAVWDDEYRASLVDMQRREQELLHRKDGRTAGSDEDGSQASGHESDDGSGSDDEYGQGPRLRRELEHLATTGGEHEPQSQLMGLKFMQRHEEALKKANDEMVEQLRKELASEDKGGGGDDDDEEEEEEADEEVGHKKFGLKKDGSTINNNKARNPFATKAISHRARDKTDASVSISFATAPETKTPALENGGGGGGGGAWSKGIETRRERKAAAKSNVAELDLAPVVLAQPQPQTKPGARSGAGSTQADTTIATTDGHDADADADADADSDGDIHVPLAIRDQTALERAFAGDDVDISFAAEKEAIVADEEDKFVDNTLPGWGSWAGSGIKKRDTAKKNSKWLTKVEGIKRKDRKDTKLEKVIINEKIIKKNSKYMASQLPFPFETRQQYERSLRVPIGPDWVTRESFQDATKPKILIKQGVIEPMSKPTV